MVEDGGSMSAQVVESLQQGRATVTGHPISRGKGRRDLSRSHSKKGSLGGDFKYMFIFTPIWGR